MKNVILLVPDDAAGGGGEGGVAALTKRVAALEKLTKGLDGLDDKLAAFELKLETLPEARLETRTEPPRIKSSTQHAQEELDELEDSPETRLALMMDHGVTEAKALATIEARKRLLREQLGLTKPAKRKIAKAAAALVAFVATLATLLCAPSAMGDQQGLPQTYNTLTNIPTVINTQSYSNFLSAGITNQITVHRGAGLGLEWLTQSGTAGVLGQGMLLGPSIDGTNIDETHTIWFWGASFGPTNICNATNWTVPWGMNSYFVIGMTNASTTGLTNNAVLYNKPNGGP